MIFTSAISIIPLRNIEDNGRREPEGLELESRSGGRRNFSTSGVSGTGKRDLTEGVKGLRGMKKWKAEGNQSKEERRE